LFLRGAFGFFLALRLWLLLTLDLPLRWLPLLTLGRPLL
jgi:hypothetical protein